MEADVETYGGIYKHGGLEESGVYHLVANGGIHILVGGYAKHHTYIAEEGGDDDALGDDEFEDGPGLGANGFADAKLTCALLDGDEHDIGHTHYAAQQREDAYHPQGDAYHTDAFCHLDIIHIAIPDVDG